MGQDAGKRLVVLGAHGQLGRELAGEGSAAGWSLVLWDVGECDITNAGAVRRALESVRPDWVVNCAAWTNVDGAESNRAMCHAINAKGAGNVAAACAGLGTRLLHLSTDFVFCDPSSSPRTERDEPRPKGVYAISKFEGERAVADAHPTGYLTVRTSWLYGKEGPNFVLTMLKLAATRQELSVVGDQHGSPTWTGSLAPALFRLMERDERGLFHLSNRGETTWCEFAREIMRQSGSGCTVREITTEEYGAPAPRPTSSYLDDEKWRALGEAPLSSWQEALSEYLAELGYGASRRDAGAANAV